MKINTKKSHSLSQIELQFRAISASFQTNTSRTFKIYLQKQAQIIGEVTTSFFAQNNKQAFPFPPGEQSIFFRILRPTHCNYQIMLYEVDQDMREIFIEEAAINISKFVDDYYKQLLANEQQLYSHLMKDHQKVSITEMWRVLIHNFSRRNISSAVKFKTISIVLEYIILATNIYDKQVQLDDIIIKKKAAQKKNRKSEFGKSKTVPQAIQIFNQQTPTKKHNQPQSQVDLNQNQQIASHEKPQVMFFTGSLPPPKIVLNKIAEAQQPMNQLQLGSGISRQKQPSTQLIPLQQQVQNLAKNNIIQPVVEELKEESEYYQTKQDQIQIQHSQFYAINTHQGKKPLIQLKAFKQSTYVDQTGYSKLSSEGLFIDSQINVQKQKHKNVSTRNVFFGVTVLSIYTILILLLMNPLSKV